MGRVKWTVYNGHVFCKFQLAVIRRPLTWAFWASVQFLISSLLCHYQLLRSHARKICRTHACCSMFDKGVGTWVRLGILIQGGGGMDWNFLHLASPVAVGQAAGVWAGLP